MSYRHKKNINYKPLFWKIGLILSVLITAIWLSSPWGEKIKLGLDLKGGTQLVLQVDVDKAIESRSGKNPHHSDTINMSQFRDHCVQQSIETIRNRIDQYGVKDAGVQRLGFLGEDKILVTLPGIGEPERIKELIKSTAVLEFKHVIAGPFASVEEMNTHFDNQIPDNHQIYQTNPKRMKIGFYVLDKTSVITGDELKKASRGRDNFGGWEVHFSLNNNATKKIRAYTAANIGKYLAIVFDDQVESVARIDEVLGQNNRISGNYTYDEVNDMVVKLQSGSLAAPLTPKKERVIGPSLGADSIRTGITAAVTGMVLVILFMVFYYGAAGVNSVTALLLNILILLGAMAYMEFTLTLTGIAGIILTIGMAVDANVLIFERIKEEYINGKSTASAIKSGFKKAFVSILDANLTTVIASLFLLQFGTGPIKGFAVTLIIGIGASMFTAVFVSRVIFQVAFLFKPLGVINSAKFNDAKPIFKGWARYCRLFKVERKISFMNKNPRRIAALVSLTIILVGFFTYMNKGFNKGIDFTGGIMLDVSFKEKTNEQAIRMALNVVGIHEAIIQKIDNTDEQYLIKTFHNPSEDTTQIIKKAIAKVGDIHLNSREMIGPQVGASLTHKVMQSAFWVMIGMLIYIGIRFRLSYGLAAVLTLAHDILICLSMLLLFNIEISLPVVAALLTVLGYSLNDTIVIFDRVRENMANMKNTSPSPNRPKQILDISIQQTLNRTIVTSCTTLIVILAMLFLGGNVLYSFSFTLLIGILVGTYSSIFQSCAWLYLWKIR